MNYSIKEQPLSFGDLVYGQRFIKNRGDGEAILWLMQRWVIDEKGKEITPENLLGMPLVLAKGLFELVVDRVTRAMSEATLEMSKQPSDVKQ